MSQLQAQASKFMVEGMQPKPIRKIGFGYKLDFMPAPLILGYHQLSKKIEHAGFNVKVSLIPLNEINSDWDLVFVPKEFESEAALVLPSECVIGLDKFVNQPYYAELLRRLEEGTEICAERVDPNQASREEGTIMRYRGYERIE